MFQSISSISTGYDERYVEINGRSQLQRIATATDNVTGKSVRITHADMPGATTEQMIARAVEQLRAGKV